MENSELKNYLKAISSKKITNVDLVHSKRNLAMKNQKSKCKICKKDLKTYFVKYIENPRTKEIEVICAECAIPIKKRN